MTFSVSRDGGKFEWAGDTIFTVFCQPKRLLDPHMWSMLYDVFRFNACARRLVAEWRRGDANTRFSPDFPIGEYLKREGYSDAFKDDYLIVSK
jgi:predicted NAD/FAD-binding protein